jgi:DNA-binding CsgD family transcriptional regulator/tetratricopeptide (TPR) repeat protein
MRERLPSSQREALEAAVALQPGPSPDFRQVGRGILTLLSKTAEAQPLLCLIDDAQWLDQASARALALVAMQVKPEPMAVVLAERGPKSTGNFTDLPELRLRALDQASARMLIDSVTPGRIDDAVAQRIIAEARGNPLALVESLRGVSAARLAGGFGVTGGGRPSHREEEFLAPIGRLRPDSQRLLLVAAAEPVGDPDLLWRAAGRLGISTEAAEPLESAGLLKIGGLVTFSHPFMRSHVYGHASLEELRDVHRALAVATDADADPDRRAWHLGQAMDGPNDEVADEVARWAGKAQERAGLTAAAAFLEKAALLTLDSSRRVERALAAASAKHDAGFPDSAARLIATAEIGALDESTRGRIDRQRARIALAARRADDAADLFVCAGRRLESHEPGLARETRLESLAVAILAGRANGDHSAADISRAVGIASPGCRPQRAIDLLLDALAARFTEGSPPAVASMRRALAAFPYEDSSRETVRWLWLACLSAADVWDDAAWCALATTDLNATWESGALIVMPEALNCRAIVDLHRGDLAGASALAEEADAIAAVIGVAPLTHASVLLAGWRGDEGYALECAKQGSQDAYEHGEGFVVSLANLSTAVLYNGLGRYDQALVAAREAARQDELGVGAWALVELIEAAARAGRPDEAAAALERLSGRARHSGTNWALGMERRSQALLSEGRIAEDLYVEAIERLGRADVSVHLARARLLYGEWLRRQGRRIDARVPLRAARESFVSMGAGAFAERASHEMLATSETARRRAPDMRYELTPQERRIAVLARAGLGNPEIGARLFVSPRTVECHLTKVFAKLGVTSRVALRRVLPDPPAQ